MDPITARFFDEQLIETQARLEGSELVRLGAVLSPQLVVVEFRCRGLVGGRDEPVREADYFVVGFRFADDYLRRVRPPEVLTLIEPLDAWHPNMGGPRTPTAICIGDIATSTPLLDLIHRVYEVITWQSFTPVEYDALNTDACAWARSNLDRFPIDPRPLRWRSGGGDDAAPPSLLASMEVVG